MRKRLESTNAPPLLKAWKPKPMRPHLPKMCFSFIQVKIISEPKNARKCFPAPNFCQEPASWHKLPARNLLPRRKFLPGTCFLAENSCQEASSWHRTCAGRRFPSASLPVQTCQTHMYFQEIGAILAHILYLNLFLSYFFGGIAIHSEFVPLH